MCARVVKLVYTLALGASGATHESSSLSSGTYKYKIALILAILVIFLKITPASLTVSQKNYIINDK